MPRNISMSVSIYQYLSIGWLRNQFHICQSWWRAAGQDRPRLRVRDQGRYAYIIRGRGDSRIPDHMVSGTVHS